MYNKIQPEQIEIHTFSSPSGSISFTKGSNYVYGNLSNNLTGNFILTGSLLINGSNLYTTDISNSYTLTNNVILGGKNNTISNGTGNAIINSTGSIVRGKNNLDLNSDLAIFDTSSKFCTVLAGKNTIIGAVTGSVVISDSTTTAVNATKSNALYISFLNGIDIRGNTVFNGDLSLTSTKNALFSGNTNFLANVSKSGLALATESFVSGVSGSLVNRMNSNQTLLGNKTFSGEIAFNGSVLNFGKTGTNHLSHDGDYIFLNRAGSSRFWGSEDETFYYANGTSPSLSWNGNVIDQLGYESIIPTGRYLSSSSNNPNMYWTGSSIRFVQKPNINGTGFLLSGEAYPASNPSGFISGISNIVYQTGNQIISGNKTFNSLPTVNGIKLQTGSIYQNKFLPTDTTIGVTSTQLILSDILPDSGIYLISSNINLRKNSTLTGYCDLSLSTGGQQLYSQRIIVATGLHMYSQSFTTIATGYEGTQFQLSGIAGTASMFTGMSLNGTIPSSNLCITKIADIY